MRLAGIAQARHFIQRHKKALLAVTPVLVVFMTADVVFAWAFDERETDGVRLETNRAVSLVGERVDMRIFIVNKLDSPISICTNTYEVRVWSVLGPVSGRAVTSEPGGPCEKFLLPGEEALVATDVLEAYFLGPHTAVVSVRTSPDLGVRFTGSVRVLAVLWRYP